ncbi:MAG TPA: GYD domain-containing protein [Gaiellaceae bacterium]|nr:GYD domain-containing protein [Gaiellaceae bacterium]
MPLYMAQLGYTAQSWAAMVESRQNREETVRAMLADAGCTLHHLWFAFGEDDAFALIEAPDNVTAAGIAIAVASSGSFRHFKTTVLMTQEETLQALEKAAGIAYVGPGAREAVPA